MCTRHYQQVRSRGEIEPPRLIGPEHHGWRGDDATYRTAHTRLVTYRGLAATYACVDCGCQADDWSYNHNAANELISDDGLRYSTDLDDYDPRCRLCHSAFDRAAG